MSEIKSILPPPFEWIAIPSAVVNLGETSYSSGTKIEKRIDDFYISKYPITNAQYQIYMGDTANLPRDKIACDSLKDDDLYPAAYLLWTEAMAFCDWLTHKLGYLVTLPNDAQWLYAAQGDDGRRYPWGNVWDSERCNSEASGIGHLTSVLKYSKGASPFGVMDMLGNTIEWCLTDGMTGNNSLNYHIPTEKLLFTYRVAMGAHYASSPQSTNLNANKSTEIFHSYVTGVRLVTDKPI